MILNTITLNGRGIFVTNREMRRIVSEYGNTIGLFQDGRIHIGTIVTNIYNRIDRNSMGIASDAVCYVEYKDELLRKLMGVGIIKDKRDFRVQKFINTKKKYLQLSRFSIVKYIFRRADMPDYLIDRLLTHTNDIKVNLNYDVGLEPATQSKEMLYPLFNVGRK